MTDRAIQISELTRDFASVRALDGLTLDVGTGEVFGFLGPNGSGKTTTIHLLLGLLAPTSGHATVLGLDPRTQGDQVRARTGALLEHHGLYEQLSAEENLEFYGRVWHLPRAERHARIRSLLDGIGVLDRRTERVGDWSRGMKQRLAVARALMHRPELVFLDEPTAGLDVVAANELRLELAALAERERVTIFLTTHNMTEAERLCDRVAVIRRGELLACARPDELRRRSGTRLTVTGAGFSDSVVGALRSRPEVSGLSVDDGRLSIELAGDVDTAPLVSLLVGAGVEVREVQRDTASLEEVFLELVEDDAGTERLEAT